MSRNLQKQLLTFPGSSLSRSLPTTFCKNQFRSHILHVALFDTQSIPFSTPSSPTITSWLLKLRTSFSKTPQLSTEMQRSFLQKNSATQEDEVTGLLVSLSLIQSLKRVYSRRSILRIMKQLLALRLSRSLVKMTKSSWLSELAKI